MEIGHLHILVENVEVSKAFYLDNFALTRVAEADFGVILRDDSGIDFVIGPADDNEVQGQRMHFGFRQNSKAEVKSKFEELSAKGKEFKTPWLENDFITLFALLDPDNNLVEVYFSNLG